LGTARPGESGNIGIAAHRDGFFRSLKDFQVGDRVEWAAKEDRFVYTVDNIEIVKPTDVQVLRARPHPSLTLVTRYRFYFVGDAPQRFVMHASMVDSGEASASALSSSVQKITKRNEP
jgi:sortase A